MVRSVQKFYHRNILLEVVEGLLLGVGWGFRDDI